MLPSTFTRRCLASGELSKLCLTITKPTAFYLHRRPYSQSGSKPVELDYTAYVPPHSDKGRRHKPVIILHGFFGSKRNWGSLSKALMQKLKRPIYALDLRNHGGSPHAEPMTYQTMAEDVWHFVDRHKLSDVSIIGHSMGGKVAMAMALAAGYEKPANILRNLIVVDVSPIRGRISQQFMDYIDTLKEIEEQGLTSRKEATEYLSRTEQDPSVRAFLLTNLLPFDKADPRARFMVPLDIFKTAVPEIGNFPYLPEERQWPGRALFLKGSRSLYIKPQNLPLIRQFFPEVVVEELDTGHWVHAERPQEFLDLVTDFIKKGD